LVDEAPGEPHLEARVDVDYLGSPSGIRPRHCLVLEQVGHALGIDRVECLRVGIAESVDAECSDPKKVE